MPPPVERLLQLGPVAAVAARLLPVLVLVDEARVFLAQWGRLLRKSPLGRGLVAQP